MAIVSPATREACKLRHLDGVGPGLTLVPVEHEGDTVMSEDEAATVVDLVRSDLGRRWSDPSKGGPQQQLDQPDVIVVAPFNAQVAPDPPGTG